MKIIHLTIILIVNILNYISNAVLYDRTKINAMMVKQHNEYRKEHDADDLQLDTELIKIAENYAKKLADENRTGHSGNKNSKGESLGENLYHWWGPKNLITDQENDAVRLWYEEIDLYDFDKGCYQQGTGHFTQLIWKDTKKVGCAAARDASSTILKVVCNYYPMGNIVSSTCKEFELNVSSSSYIFIKYFFYLFLISLLF